MPPRYIVKLLRDLVKLLRDLVKLLWDFVKLSQDLVKYIKRSHKNITISRDFLVALMCFHMTQLSNVHVYAMGTFLRWLP